MNSCAGSESLADDILHEIVLYSHFFTCVMYEASCDLLAWNSRPVMEAMLHVRRKRVAVRLLIMSPLGIVIHMYFCKTDFHFLDASWGLGALITVVQIGEV